MADEQQRPEPDSVPIDAALREQVRASSWRRRFEAEADRAELMETAFGQGRAEIHALREEVAALLQQVADRDTEIEALRARLDPAEVPAGEPEPPEPPAA